MPSTRIYADFNGIVNGPRNPERTAVVLDTFGSLRDLSNAGLVLTEGLPLIAVDWSDDEEDLEGHGTAQYDRDNAWWVVELDEAGVRYVLAGVYWRLLHRLRWPPNKSLSGRVEDEVPNSYTGCRADQLNR